VIADWIANSAQSISFNIGQYSNHDKSLLPLEPQLTDVSRWILYRIVLRAEAAWLHYLIIITAVPRKYPTSPSNQNTPPKVFLKNAPRVRCVPDQLLWYSNLRNR